MSNWAPIAFRLVHAVAETCGILLDETPIPQESGLLFAYSFDTCRSEMVEFHLSLQLCCAHPQDERQRISITAPSYPTSLAASFSVQLEEEARSSRLHCLPVQENCVRWGEAFVHCL
jgi:hypothetical protein